MNSTECAASSQKFHKLSDGGVGIPVDRISNLPESLICYILSFIPTRYAVATNVLSKRWRFLWTQVPALDFNFAERLCLNVGSDEKEEDGEERMNFVNIVPFINKVLINHKAETVDKFCLKWEEPQEVYINIWVSYAIARSVKFLDLYVGCPAKFYEEESEFRADTDWAVHLPASLFTCGTLESLRLYGPFVVEVSCLVYLPKLKYLYLYEVLYESGESFRKLLSGCPVLHQLSIQRQFDDNMRVYDISSPLLRSLRIWFSNELIEELKLDVPALEYLSLSGGFSSQEISLQGLTSLNEASLSIEYKQHSVDNLVRAVSCVKSLKLDNNIFSRDTVASFSHAAARMATRFERLTKLLIDTTERLDWSFLDFLNCSMKLQVLCISKYGSCKVQCWRSPVQVPACLFDSLAEVSFSGFEGVNDEIEFIRYILRHGAVMKLINLVCKGSCDTQEKLDILQKISMFPRISHLTIKFC